MFLVGETAFYGKKKRGHDIDRFPASKSPEKQPFYQGGSLLFTVKIRCPLNPDCVTIVVVHSTRHTNGFF